MKNYKYYCVKNQQRDGNGAPTFLLFHAKARDIFDWAAIERYTADSQKGPQRLQKPAKVAEVKRFFEKDPRNTIPTALLVSLRVPTGSLTTPFAEHPEVVVLEFQWNDQAQPPEKPGMIIDGQHRLLGTKAFEEDLPLNVVAMINTTDDETAFQFLVVNNKASKVPTNHLRAVVQNYQEEELSKRLRDIRMSISQHLNFVAMVDTEPGSPFNGKIDWPNNQREGQPPAGFVPPNAIESSIAYIKQKRIQELEDDAILLGFFLTIWTKVATVWTKQFARETHLLEKVPIICLNQFLTDNLSYEYDNDMLDVTNFEKVSESVGRMLDCINPKLWEVKWIAKSLDTSAGRAMLVETLTTVRRNLNAGRDWYESVAIVDLQSDLL